MYGPEKDYSLHFSKARAMKEQFDKQNSIVLVFWSELELPDPIPNSEVKRLSADGSYPARDYENRSRPEQCCFFVAF